MQWLQEYNDREQLQIAACRAYLDRFGSAGLPGHNLMILVARMAAQLDNAEGGTDFYREDPKAVPNSPLSTGTRPRLPGEPATDRQFALISKLRTRQGLTEAQLDERTMQLYGCNLAQLTKPEASSLIDAMQAQAP